MKRTLLILTALVAVNVASAQFFVKAGAGYNFSALTQASVDTYVDTVGGKNDTYQTTQRHSYGNGLGIEAAVGYDFSENMGFQLGARYLLSTSPLTHKTTQSGITRNTETKAKGALFLMPAFTLSSNGDKFNLYSRVGLTLPVGGVLETQQDVTGSGFDYESTVETKGKLSIGYNAALGLGIPLSDKLSFWAELNGNFLNVAGDTRTLSRYYNVSSQKDLLPNFTTSQKEFEYVETVGPNDNTDPNQPTKIVTEDAPFSSVGLAVGIKFSLGNSREERREGDR